MSIAADIARFVASLDFATLPRDIQERARTCVLNGYGIALNGWMTPYAPVARAAAIKLFGERHHGATLLGDGRVTCENGAIIANAALFHGRAQEDTCGSAHLGTVLIPLLTALFESRGYPMERFLPALVAGYEVGGLFEGAYIAHSRKLGLRASPVYGTLAAAVAAAKAMGLPAPRIAAAMANAASFTGGIAQSLAEGSDEWRYQIGVASANGLVAAELAAEGSVSASHAFEGAAGFIVSIGAPLSDAARLPAKLGKEWSLRRVAFKPYPVCAFNQTPVVAALAVRERVDLTRIARARIRMNPGETGYSGLDSQGPFTTVTGTLMSTPFCVATTLIHGEPTMQRIADFNDKEVQRLTQAIVALPDAAVPPLSCVLEIEMADGERVAQEQMCEPEDYAYSWADAADRLRRIGALSGVPTRAFDLVETFAGGLPSSDLEQVRAAFALVPAASRHAHAAA
jgi:2-methylcitrate dehydratase PrpD